MSEIPEAQKCIQGGIDHFRQSMYASQEANTKIENGQNALMLAAAGILQVVKDIKRAEGYFNELSVLYGAMASSAEDGARAFKGVAERHDIAGAGGLIECAENIANNNKVLGEGQATGMEHLSAFRSMLEDGGERLVRSIAGWEKRRTAMDGYSDELIPRAIIQPAEQLRDSL